MAKKNLGKAIANGNLSYNEAMKIAGGDQSRLSKLAYRANQEGATIGGRLVKTLGSGASGAYNNFMSNWSGNNDFKTFMKGMQGLNLGKGQAYGGASMTAGQSGNSKNGGYWSTPATYNPMVMMKGSNMPKASESSEEASGKAPKRSKKMQKRVDAAQASRSTPGYGAGEGAGLGENWTGSFGMPKSAFQSNDYLKAWFN